jgi:hypothetical protein
LPASLGSFKVQLQVGKGFLGVEISLKGSTTWVPEKGKPNRWMGAYLLDLGRILHK